MPDPRVAFCIFCDDIRQEAGNKYSVMGIYGSDIVFTMPRPALVPKFGVVIWLHSDIGDEPTHIKITVLMPPDQEEFMSLEIDVPTPTALASDDDSTKRHMRTIIPFPPFEFTHEGLMEVFVDTGREKLRAGRLMMRSRVVETNAPDQQEAPEA